MRVLLFSTLYPSAARPIHGIFVETRLRELLKTGEVQAQVVAPVPWFPSSAPCFGEYAHFAATPRFEERNGIAVHHPSYLLLPKVGMSLAPFAMALGALPTLRRLQREGFDFDLIDAHYYYPDGVAAGLLAKWLGKPFVVTARGSDINLIAQYRWPRRLMAKTAHGAAASITVSRALASRLIELGAPEAKLHVLRNGVDPIRFSPIDQMDARHRLGLSTGGPQWLMVGNLVELKGHSVVLDALTRVPDVSLMIVGGGPLESALREKVVELGLASRVRWFGKVAQDDLKWHYSAADALVLCSSREGWPNVLLESIACGTPVLSTAVSGTPDIVTTPAAGVLIRSRDPQGVVDAWMQLQSHRPAREATRAHAHDFSWDSTSRGQLQLFANILREPPRMRATRHA
jgi:teichuronic acid biosynthesis glycosyltransferase TuaC